VDQLLRELKEMSSREALRCELVIARSRARLGRVLADSLGDACRGASSPAALSTLMVLVRSEIGIPAGLRGGSWRDTEFNDIDL